MTSRSRNLLLAFGALGLGAASTSSYVHYRLLEDPSYASFCDINTTVSCTQAYLSQYGSVSGVPVALAGVLFFALVLVLAGLAGRRASASSENAPGYIFALSTVGLAMVLYLGWASYFVLKAFCVLCAITYVAVIAIFIISGGATTFPMTTLPRRALRDLRTLVTSPIALVVLLLFLGGAGALLAYFPHAGGSTQGAAPSYPPLTSEQRVSLEKWWDVQPKIDIPIPDQHVKVVVLKFSDYMCPHCRQSEELYRSIFARYEAAGKLKYLFKHFPLEPECNSNAPAGTHFASCEASAAVVMARPAGKEEALSDWIFTNQAGLTVSAVKQAARDVAGVTNFDERYAGALQEVKMDASLGGLLQVGSTPTYFINGRRVVGVYPPQAIEGIIELELKRAK